MPAPTAEPDAGRLVTALSEHGYAIAAGFLDAGAIAGLVADLRALEAQGDFRPAAVGAGAARAARPEIRGDRIAWLHEPSSAAQRLALAPLESLRGLLNRELQLGLVELECHYAIYAPGGAYQRHLDRSPRGVERVVTAILYLNAGWRPADGGELRLYADRGTVSVAPRGGTLLLFMSERFEHEVLPAVRERLSLSGWFRRRPPI